MTDNEITGHEQPASELSELTGALRAHLAREERKGRTRVNKSGPLPELVQRDAPAPAHDLPLAPAPDATAQSEPRYSPAPARSTASTTPQAPTSTPFPSDLAPLCADLDALREAVVLCRACDLCDVRKQTVFADGNGSSRVLFIGEAPGAEEDARGLPFVGPSGQLLTDIITKGMQLRREDVYIANVLKCRPPENRDPAPVEKALCTAWLDRQIELVDPRVIITLGKHASQHVLSSQEAMGKMRGRVHIVRGRQVVPTYHPAFLLRSPGMKRECWLDIKIAMGLLEDGR